MNGEQVAPGLLGQSEVQEDGSVGNVIDMRLRKAHTLIQQGVDQAARGRVEEAKENFRASVNLSPTAEGYTYWAWMLSHQGELDQAIALCQKAIDVDSTFGNAYNDIGTYLMKKGDLDDAIPWLEKAKTAARYEPRHYPYLNLGRIYLSQCLFAKALIEFDGALVFDPDNLELQAVAERIRTRLIKE